MKPIVVYTRPKDWFSGGYKSEKLDMIFVPISGDVPRKRNGRIAGDGIGDVLTEKGIKTLYLTVKKYQPQVFFHSIHAKIDKRILKIVKSFSPKTLIIVNESNYPNDVSPYFGTNRNWTDGVLLNSRDKQVYNRYCALAYEPRMVDTFYDGFSPKDIVYVDRERKFDCFFGGSNLYIDRDVFKFPLGKFRESFIKGVAKEFNLDLHGSSKEWGSIANGILTYPHYFPSFQNSNIILGSNHYDLTRYYTRRLIHSVASGRMFLTRYIPEMEEDFTNRKHLVWFHTLDEGFDMIRYYLKNPKERETIARQGRELFLAKHTWKARLAEFEKYVERILA